MVKYRGKRKWREGSQNEWGNCLFYVPWNKYGGCESSFFENLKESISKLSGPGALLGSSSLTVLVIALLVHYGISSFNFGNFHFFRKLPDFEIY